MLDIDFMSKNDLELAVLMEEKDQESMAYFYDKYAPAVYGIICRIIKEKHMAEDCLAATFIQAWDQVADFRNSGISLFNWLLNIGRQSAFGVMRQHIEKNLLESNSVYGLEKRYSAFELVYIKGLTVEQAAGISGVTVVEFKINIRKELKFRTGKMELV